MPGGPRPVRIVDHPFGCPGLTHKERTKVKIDSEVFLRALDFLDGTLSTGGAGMKEHPGDRRCRPYPSIFRTPQWRALARRHTVHVYDIDQRMLGAPSRKRTSLGMGRLPFDFSDCKCKHKGRHAQNLGGFDKAAGKFKTSGSEAYPSEMCRRIAESFLRSFDAGRLARAEEALAPFWLGASALSAKGHVRAGARPCGEVWPSAACADVPPRVTRGRDPREVLGASEALRGLVSKPRADMGLYGN